MKTKRFCTHCGYMQVAEKWPRRCPNPECREWTLENPVVAVAAVLVRMRREAAVTYDDSGVLIVKRKTEPAKGTWALPGGFIEIGETWQEACVRELEEETTVKIPAADIRLFDVQSIEGGARVLIFGETHSTVLDEAALDAINKNLHNDEVSEVSMLRGDRHHPVKLGFPTHTLVAQQYLVGLKQ
jgi:8-oxo-dGTP diphosphatase